MGVSFIGMNSFNIKITWDDAVFMANNGDCTNKMIGEGVNQTEIIFNKLWGEMSIIIFVLSLEWSLGLNHFDLFSVTRRSREFHLALFNTHNSEAR